MLINMKTKILEYLVPIICLIVLSIAPATAQDLIVTADEDSIHCKITKINDDYIYFSFKYENEIRSTLLLKSNIETFHFNYYKDEKIPENKIIGYEDFDRFRFALNGGYSYYLGKIQNSVKLQTNFPAGFEEYLNELRNSFHFGTDATYYLSEIIGIGCKYLFFPTYNKYGHNIYILNDDGSRKTGKLSNDIHISFAGPVLSTRFFNGDKTKAVLSDFSIGYMWYKNHMVIVDQYELTGKNIGLAYDLMYEGIMRGNIWFGIRLSLILGTLTELTNNTGVLEENIHLDKDSRESMSRFDVSLGLRYIL